MLAQESDPLSFAPLLAALLSVAGLVLLSEKPRLLGATAACLGLAVGLWMLLWLVVAVQAGNWIISVVTTHAPIGSWSAFGVNATAALFSWLCIAAPAAYLGRQLGLRRERSILTAVVWFFGMTYPLIRIGANATPQWFAFFALSVILTVGMALAVTARQPRLDGVN